MMRLCSLVFSGLAAALALAGCTHAPLHHEDLSCNGIDWWEAGRTDGVAGIPLAKSLRENRRRCDGSKNPVDLEAFEVGHEAGLVDYCTPAQGFALGRSGLAYEKSCPSNLEGPFLQQYQMGAKLRAMEVERSEANAEKSSAAL